MERSKGRMREFCSGKIAVKGKLEKRGKNRRNNILKRTELNKYKSRIIWQNKK